MTFYKNITSFSADTYKVGKPLGTHNPLLVTSQGTVRWLAPVILKSTCKLRVRYFPFDEQFCKLKFVSWTYSKSALVLEPEDTEILQNYTGNFIYLSLRFSPLILGLFFFAHYVGCKYPWTDAAAKWVRMRHHFCRSFPPTNNIRTNCVSGRRKSFFLLW